MISIVIVCMNRPDNLYPCLRSIREHTHTDYEILVVAYRFSEENLTPLREDFPEVNFIISDEIRGFSENNNLALAQARGEYCFILNDDTELHEDVISRLESDFSKLPESAAIVCPKLINPDGSLQLCGRPPYPARNYLLQQWHLHKEPIDDTTGRVPLCDELFQTSNISGAAFLIRTDIFRELGFFDERYFFTPEDIALSTLAGEKRYGVYVDRAVSVVHKWRTTASKMSVAVRPAAVKGSLIFFGRSSKIKYCLLSCGVLAAEWVKCVKAFFRYKIRPTEENKIKYLTFRAIVCGICSRKTPKELFVYFLEY